ncbi:MAG: DEAD/DEAH box helicase [Pirellulaceae bacterium]
MSLPSQEERDQIAERYLEQLSYEPYPVQEEALFSWFSEEQGVMVCAPTGTGKTLIAEAAIFEALQLGRTAYYTTPLIALTDQKYRELQESAVKWGFRATDVGLATGNRKVNPDAPIQVVVAEILLNRLLHGEAFDFTDVWAVVMDEFHSFNDRERGIVWEFGLGLLPKQVKTLLLSATVGNAYAFGRWLATRHDRELKLVESTERKVPLSYRWVADQLLDEQIEEMFAAEGDLRMTPALIFCFNREQCWSTAELLKGKKVVDPEQQKRLATELEQYDWSQGVGPKLKQILMRGVGVHHAGVMPKYRRIVEDLFQQKLLSVCVCTETLAAGINLPARSVVLPTLMKGPPRKQTLVEAASAQQMFGRAGRPQFDDRGFVFALAHEDDVKILRFQERMNQIPEDTKDPNLIRKRKELKKKMPKRREGVQYWNEQQFEQLVNSKSADLESRGPLTWRLLAYMLDASPDVDRIRHLVGRRLLQGKAVEQAEKQLTRMLVTLHRAGYVQLSPPPPLVDAHESKNVGDDSDETEIDNDEVVDATEANAGGLTLDLGQRKSDPEPPQKKAGPEKKQLSPGGNPIKEPDYRPMSAEPTDRLPMLLKLKGVHPLYAMFLMNHLGIADRNEKIQAMESLLEISPSLGRAIDVPPLDEMPSGPLATSRLDPQLLKLGLATVDELNGPGEDEDPRDWRDRFVDGPPRVLTLAHKLQRIFQFDYPGVDDLHVRPCWVAGEILEFGGDFNLYITTKKLQKQEGIVFRHLLRMVLLIDEFAMLCPPEIEQGVWQDELGDIAYALEQTCRAADASSTDQWLDEARQAKGTEV